MDSAVTIARALYAQERDAEGEAVLRAAIAAEPTNPDLWPHLAALLLVQGKYREGFRAFEMRGERRLGPLRGLSYPEWEGAPLAGRSILVSGEQGIGDEVMFARFVPALRELGASRISAAVRSANVRLFESLGVDAVFARDAGAVAIPGHDCWAMIGSLPHRLGVTPADLSGAPYLQGAVAPRDGSGIGIIERGDPTHSNDANRSVPEGLLRAALPDARPLEASGDTIDSLEQLAGLELLITVDTSWAHLAGALDVPCWLLIPFGRSDWRWMRQRADSPWYRSVRLFRQPAPGDWSAVVRDVLAALASRQASSCAARPLATSGGDATFSR